MASKIGALLPFSLSRVKSLNRIGPHNIDILSILIGSLLVFIIVNVINKNNN